MSLQHITSAICKTLPTSYPRYAVVRVETLDRQTPHSTLSAQRSSQGRSRMWWTLVSAPNGHASLAALMKIREAFSVGTWAEVSPGQVGYKSCRSGHARPAVGTAPAPRHDCIHSLPNSHYLFGALVTSPFFYLASCGKPLPVECSDDLGVRALHEADHHDAPPSHL